MSEAPTVALDVDPVWGQDEDWERTASEAAGAAAAVATELANPALLVSIVLGGDSEVQALNKQWRAKNRPTNVLSFPMLSRDEVLRAGRDPGRPAMLGDMILAHGVCHAEARERGIAPADHVAHLIVHGLLHIAGYDHADEGEAAAVMEDLERQALALMGIEDPYRGAA